MKETKAAVCKNTKPDVTQNKRTNSFKIQMSAFHRINTSNVRYTGF